MGPPTDLASGSLRYRRATPNDLTAVVGLLTEAAEWAKQRGVERWWPVPFPSDGVRRGIDQQEVVLVEIDGEPVATLTLRRDDPIMWGDQPPVAGYVHRLAVRRDHAGRQLGRTALAWAGDEVRRWGRSKLRLDCLATNPGLVRYYRAQGFREVARVAGNVPGEDRPSILWERDLT